MKKNVCIIFGGASSEHEVSCISAYNIIKNIDEEKYNLILVGITKSGESYLYKGEREYIKNGKWVENPGKACVISPNPAHHGILVFNKNGDFFTESVDVYFPVLHGKNGEDGTIQGVFELSKIPYVGNKVLGSAVSMDKIMTKKILQTENIPVTEGFNLTLKDFGDTDGVNEKIKGSFGYPVVIKPSNAGSSVGISLVENEKDLREALSVAFKEDSRVLVEKMMNIREIECAVYGNSKEAYASVLGEIVKTTALYDYDTKYIDDTTTLVIPAELDSNITEKIRELAIRVFYALDCRGLARVDFFVDKETNEIYLNEINTLPGFTNISMYPMLWAKSGVSYSELLDKLISLAEE